MRRTIRSCASRIRPVVVVVAGGLAAAGCQYFSNVVVPANDPTPPTAISGAYELTKGAYQALSFDQAGAFELAVNDDTETFLAVSAGMDDGGPRNVEMLGPNRDPYGPIATMWCTDARGVDHVTTVQTWGQPVVSQHGNVGDTVSNGLWTYVPVRFDQFDACPAGTRLRTATFAWSTRAEDMAFHATYGTNVSIRYTP
jgi:hypothetical protein